MSLVERSKLMLLDLGASPVMYLMIALSIASIAVMLERGWFFVSIRENVERLARMLSEHLDRNDVGAAYEAVQASRSAEAAVVAAGLRSLERGPEAAEEAMASATALQRMRLERRLAFLGTLGNNAPFVGLLGTVIGIVQAFDKLQSSGAGGSANTEVMGAIAEALVATAIGLAVAIPAVAAFNYFQRRIKSTLGNAEALRHIVLSYLKTRSGHGSVLAGGIPVPARSEESSQPFRIERARAVAG
jgi:biopolymer transport protein ExbB